jgi:hypothetical protein
MFRIYLMPMVTQPFNPSDPNSPVGRMPKYRPAGQWSIIDLGDIGQDECLMGAEVTEQEHQQAQNAIDVLTIPANLDSPVGQALATVQTELEARSIPSDWVSSTTLWRDVVRRVAGLALFLQRLSGIIGRSTGDMKKLFSEATLSSAVPPRFRQPVQQAASELGIDLTGLTAQSTVRQLFARVTSEDRGMTVTLGGVSI